MTQHPLLWPCLREVRRRDYDTLDTKTPWRLQPRQPKPVLVFVAACSCKTAALHLAGNMDRGKAGQHGVVSCLSTLNACLRAALINFNSRPLLPAEVDILVFVELSHVYHLAKQATGAMPHLDAGLRSGEAQGRAATRLANWLREFLVRLYCYLQRIRHWLKSAHVRSLSKDNAVSGGLSTAVRS